MGNIVSPLPSIGEVVTGRDVAGRELRVSGHPESGRVVLSIWQSGHCQATIRLAPADIPDVTRALIAGLVPPELTGPVAPAPSGRSGESSATGEATVHLLRRGTEKPIWGTPQNHPDNGRRGAGPGDGDAPLPRWFRRATAALAVLRHGTPTPRD